MKSVECRDNIKPIPPENAPDGIWIIENAAALFDFASTNFKIHGAGVVHIDRRNLLKPPHYIIATEVGQYRQELNLEEFIKKYDPHNSFVLLLESEQLERPYRVDIVKI